MVNSVSVVGASGKLGSLVVRIIESSPDYVLHSALGSRSQLSEMDGADLVVDVSTPAASAAIVTHALSVGARVLVGTSGWSQERLATLGRSLGDDQGVVVIPNFSLGSVLGTTLAAIAGRFYDSIEIIEAHGAAKVDSPSGTAVRTAEQIDAARSDRGPTEAPHADQRARGELIAGIPVHSLRMRGIVAQQSVILGGEGETLTITHDTINQGAYEPGIRLALAKALATPGLTVGLENVIDLGIAR